MCLCLLSNSVLVIMRIVLCYLILIQSCDSINVCVCVIRQMCLLSHSHAVDSHAAQLKTSYFMFVIVFVFVFAKSSFVKDSDWSSVGGNLIARAGQLAQNRD